MAEFGSCHRNESSGGLHGLLRVRSFVQDDGHIFCSEDQINGETVEFCRSLLEIYKDFGFLKIILPSTFPSKIKGCGISAALPSVIRRILRFHPLFFFALWLV
jgi:threonyl-tRNA synthetase